MKTTRLELSQRLKALGVPQQSTFYWYLTNLSTTADWILTNGRFPSSGDFCSSYSSDELGEWWPLIVDIRGFTMSCEVTKKSDGWHSYLEDGYGDREYKTSKGTTLAEAMGMMLEYLIINGYIKVEDLK